MGLRKTVPRKNLEKPGFFAQFSLHQHGHPVLLISFERRPAGIAAIFAFIRCGWPWVAPDARTRTDVGYSNGRIKGDLWQIRE
jgi:hypothetical protein